MQTILRKELFLRKIIYISVFQSFSYSWCAILQLAFRDSDTPSAVPQNPTGSEHHPVFISLFKNQRSVRERDFGATVCCQRKCQNKIPPKSNCRVRRSQNVPSRFNYTQKQTLSLEIITLFWCCSNLCVYNFLVRSVIYLGSRYCFSFSLEKYKNNEKLFWKLCSF